MKQQSGDQRQPHFQSMAMPDSFAEMLRMQPKLRETIKLPSWFWEDICLRKDQASLTEVEQERFICAYNVLINNGTIGKLADIHADGSHLMHGNPRFFPWHRVFLKQLEEALHTVHPDVCIPYWDWTKKAGQNFPSWLAGFTPVVTTPTRTITILRSPGTVADMGTIASGVAGVMAFNTYNDFWTNLEGIHGAVHVWVGGTMGFVSTAAADPIFWMHHANIDRLWWDWYNSPAGAGKNPPLSGMNAIMDPWAYTEADTRNIISMGFKYV
ncbi:MAG: tyrosinase family protein [Ginsengibacter sp.]